VDDVNGRQVIVRTAREHDLDCFVSDPAMVEVVDELMRIGRWMILARRGRFSSMVASA